MVKTGRDPPQEEQELGFQEKKTLCLDTLEQKHTFVAPDDVQILYLYQEGVYVLGETIVKGEIEKILGDKGSSGLCNEVIKHFERRNYVERSEFNKFNTELPLENGVLNLETFEITPHTPDKIFTFKLETVYNPEKKAPKFMKFFNQIITNKEDMQVIQEFMGYTLLPSFPHHNFLILMGVGRNGKGSLVRTIIGILGDDNVSAVPLSYLDGKHRFTVANLFGKLMNVCSEPASTKGLYTEILKQITGQDRVDGEIKNRQHPLQFTPFAKFIILANRLPPVYDVTLSFWDRLLLVELKETFTDAQGNKIPNIEQQWLSDSDERSGILNWMIEGLTRLQSQGGFTQTKEMKQKKLEYKRASDSIGAFFEDEDQCIFDPKIWILRADLYNAYKIYAEELGVTIETNNKFIARVRLLPNVVDRPRKINRKTERTWQGIGIVSPQLREEKRKVASVTRVTPISDLVSGGDTVSSDAIPHNNDFSLNSQIEKGATRATGATSKANSPLKGVEGSLEPPVNLGLKQSLQYLMDEFLRIMGEFEESNSGEAVNFELLLVELVSRARKTG